MNRFFDELEERLRTATTEQHALARSRDAAPAARRRGWTRRHRRLLVAAPLALVGFAVPAVGAVTDLWRPDVKPAPPMRTVKERPSHDVVSCGNVPEHRLDVGPRVGAAFTSVLGVLARPRTAADAFDRRYLRPLGLLGVDLAGIRSVGLAADGKRVFVIPARGFGQQPWPARCLRGLHGHRRALLAHPKQRREPVVFLFGGGGGGVIPLAAIRAHGTYARSGTTRGRATVTGLVPNGVRAVRVTYGRSTRSFPVRDNFFSFRVAVDVEQPPDRIEWRMEDGSVRDVTP
jgi:hypothetical protein